VWGLALGCGDGTNAPPTNTPPTNTPDPTVTEPTAVYSALKTDIDRLNALTVVHVGTLVVEGLSGREATACYSTHPCDYVASEPAVAAEYARQAPRLNRLAAIAENAARREYPTSGTLDTPADLAALNALEIVSFGFLLTVLPQNDASCYNLPCPDELARVAAENHKRASILHGLAVDATADEGL
jgi:hypothetical protein